MRLDKLFEEYRDSEIRSENLQNEVAKDALDFCMRAVYWNKKYNFQSSLDEDEAISVFNDIFLECLNRALEGKSKTLSGCFCFIYPLRLKTYIGEKKKLPKTLSEMVNTDETSPGSFLDNLITENQGHEWISPESGILYEELNKDYLELLDSLPELQREALLLNVNRYSHQEIAEFLNIDKQKVNKNKYEARQKFRKTLNKEE